MATPSSSGTTPSPRPPFLQASAVSPSTTPIAGKDSDQLDREERERAIQKFFANAELAQLARGLRARLSYASFKATHNLAQTNPSDLEAQTHDHAAAMKMSIGRSGSNHYNNPATQGNSAMITGASSRGLTRKGTMLPPSSVTASATQSLFSSLLQPPPSKRARTIHNPEDPPVPPPSKARPATPQRKTAKTSRVQSSSSVKSKSRKDVKGKKRETAPSSRLITPQSTLGSEGFIDNDDDMKAAATLTSLLHSRPSVSVTASSPRSSMSAGSDGGGGSTQSYPNFAQSSARTTAPTSLVPSAEHSFNVRYTRSTTPPSSSRHARTQSLPHVGSSTTTPKTQVRPADNRLSSTTTPHPPSDTEAADLMLFLATSPSPVRPTASKDRDGKDSPAFRSLSGATGLKGRVLFPGPGQGPDDRNAPANRALRRDGSSTFGSTSSIEGDASQGGAAGPSRTPIPSSPLNPHARPAQRSNDPGEPGATDTRGAQLLPAPTSPTRARPLERSASVPVTAESRAATAAASPMGPSFNLHEFLNVSPSPAAGAGSSKLTSLRANVGRKLFEENIGLNGGALGRENVAAGAPAGGGGLGAGIDLVKSSV
ncbi:hypothetical protein PsYK624_046580 [Phanerochaete sordida]|uniref:Uncharacterized protein n=1 Tax=Phanerochaete sordida TaxID=48140 RepID=A0A9P3G6S0_9APHY|nr:hypothetical protein PsYK624_046580 [Phanerochaete sordida]